jgi:hypothetical protein
MPDEKITYWKSNRFFHVFIKKMGDQGCKKCPDENVRLSFDRPPPPLKGQPRAVGIRKAVETKGRFRAWMDSRLAKRVGFDLQDIPETIRKLGMPVAAAMFRKWFTGELNYPRTEKDSERALNQQGLPYPDAMIDRKSISLRWVLGFARAKTVYDSFRLDAALVTTRSMEELRIIFTRHLGKHEVLSNTECSGDIHLIHKQFQFQCAMVKGSWAQKIGQFVKREVIFRGMPDELTLVLGSFNFYAAISRMILDSDAGGRYGMVTHIYIYAKGEFNFTDPAGEASQYLGHWNRKNIAIVPLQEASVLAAKTRWVDHPVFSNHSYADPDVLYPVKNSDFRRWQLAHEQGGDFIIYTDKISVFLVEPIKIYL